MKSTGNIAVDMISACLDHYKKYGKKVNRVTLSRKYWTIFKGYMVKQKPDLVIDDAIDFNNVRVEKGSMFQIDALKADWVKQMEVVK